MGHVRLRVHDAPGSEGDLPASLFLELCAGETFGRSEADFYVRDDERLRWLGTAQLDRALTALEDLGP